MYRFTSYNNDYALADPAALCGEEYTDHMPTNITHNSESFLHTIIIIIAGNFRALLQHILILRCI